MSRVYRRGALIATFFVLYSYQGCLFGLNDAIRMLLKQAKVGDSEIALMSLTSSPFYLKFLAAPFMDVYYFQAIGKRMSYILPLGFAMAILFGIGGLFIQHWIDTANVTLLAAYMFAQFVLVAIQDVAVDGMVCEVLREEDFEKGTLMQTLGQTLGGFFCSNLLILVISERFAKETFGIEGPLLSLNAIMLGLGIWVVSTTFIARSLVEEHQQKGELAIKELMGYLPQMCRKPPILLLMLFPTVMDSFLLFTDSLGTLKLLEKGLDLVYINQLEVYFFLFDLAVLAGMSRLNVMENLWKYFNISTDLLYLGAVVFWILFYCLSVDLHPNIWLGFLIAYRVVRYLSMVKFTCRCVFTQLVADKNCGGSYLTIVNSANNFCSINTPALLTSVTKWTGFMPLVTVLAVWDGLCRLMVRPRLQRYFTVQKSTGGFNLSSKNKDKLN